MKKANKLSLVLLGVLSSISVLGTSCDNDTKDETYPQIKTDGIVAVPTDCDVFKRGDVIPLNYLLTDDTELGSYNVEVHQNFDHHSHSTTSVECDLDEKREPSNPWVYEQDFSIPAGTTSYVARHNISIPTDIDTGDYHFVIRVTDHAGWQQIHAVSIKIVE